MRGARWVRENVLERYPDADLAVYAVWLPMLATDARDEWEQAALPGERVRHYWDGERTIGTWLGEQDLGGLGSAGVVWDAYFVFGPDAGWDDVPGPLLAAGAPVVVDTDGLEGELVPLLQ